MNDIRRKEKAKIVRFVEKNKNDDTQKESIVFINKDKLSPRIIKKQHDEIKKMISELDDVIKSKEAQLLTSDASDDIAEYIAATKTKKEKILSFFNNSSNVKNNAYRAENNHLTSLLGEEHLCVSCKNIVFFNCPKVLNNLVSANLKREKAYNLQFVNKMALAVDSFQVTCLNEKKMKAFFDIIDKLSTEEERSLNLYNASVIREKFFSRNTEKKMIVESGFSQLLNYCLKERKNDDFYPYMDRDVFETRVRAMNDRSVYEVSNFFVFDCDRYVSDKIVSKEKTKVNKNGK